ncbi:isochorismate synthase MenF [Martelella alba]|uniref:isochorismate synthase n=1 Tax=Martelella alba TaxID=2590451 RepID=A0ABY2SHK3_9HYPH|nr:isochorismate synthase MenF [Martelella alba]TKI04776.1 isochorismate synthase MenF [Martelella alba]
MLSLLRSALQQHIATDIPAAPGIFQIILPWTPDGRISMLDWLNASPLFPQFYWQHRNGDLEAGACGGLKMFNRPAQAQAFLAGHADRPSLRLWGLNAFGSGAGEPDSSLFLPRLTWQRDVRTHRLIINLASDHSVLEDARHFAAQLATFVEAVPIEPLAVRETAACHQPERRQWADIISQALRALADGRFAKVVLARRTRLDLSGHVRAGALMAASKRVNRHCYHYLLRWSAQRAFLGSSPERLYRRRHNRLDTEALAGTAAVGETPAARARLADWLMNDDKNQRENLLVVDDICQRLHPAAVTLDVAPPEVIGLRTVQHLRRSIMAELDCRDDARCLSLLQPTAAVAGLPRDAARHFIAWHEPFERQWYAGSAGYLSLEQAEFNVSLRCALLENQSAWLYAGAGIIEGSDAEQEWAEIDHKADGMRTLFAASESINQ